MRPTISLPESEARKMVSVYETMLASLEAEAAAAKLDWLKEELAGLVKGARTNLMAAERDLAAAVMTRIAKRSKIDF